MASPSLYDQALAPSVKHLLKYPHLFDDFPPGFSMKKDLAKKCYDALYSFSSYIAHVGRRKNLSLQRLIEIINSPEYDNIPERYKEINSRRGERGRNSVRLEQQVLAKLKTIMK